MAKVTSAERLVGGRRFKCEAECIRRDRRSGKEEVEVRVFERVPGLFARKKLVRVDYYERSDSRSVQELFDESLRWIG